MKTMRVMAIAGTLIATGAVMPADGQQAGATAPAAQASASQTEAGSKKADRALAKKVRRALAKTSGMVLTDMRVQAKDGAVTLAGSVPSAAIAAQASEVAGSVDGVQSMTNLLKVRIDPRAFSH